MPYRMLCTDVQREGAKLSPNLASGLFYYLLFHKVWYDIHRHQPIWTTKVTFTTFADVPALVVIVAVTVPLYVLPDWQVEQLLKLPLMVTLDVPPGPREVLAGLADNQPAFPSSHAIETVPVGKNLH